MGQSIENEDSKSAQGSRLSIPGSKASIQGSRPSIFSSQTSFPHSGSRSQMFSPAFSTSLMPSGAGNQRDDDTLSLPLSGRTTSPLLQQSSLNSSLEVPTRDEPAGHAPPLAMSHDLGTGVKDFASMTCIPNHSALSADVHTSTTRVPMDPDPKPENPTESGSSRRLSLNNSDLGALTTISGRKSSSTSEPGGNNSREKTEDAESEKKSKSKLSRLEMLTSLRASMRKAAMRMSFKGKKKKDSVVVANETAVSEQETTPTRDRSSACRHSDNSDQPISPGEVKGRQRAYTEFPQLSQPNLYYPPHPYPMLNYPQLSQSYGFPPPPMQVPLDNPFGRVPRPPPQEHAARYHRIDTPDYSDITTPEHSRYGDQDEANTPETFLQQDSSPSDDYLQTTNPNELQRATSPTISNHSNEGRSPEHDHYPDARTTSDPYRVHSPVGYNGKPLPTVHEQYHFNGYRDDLQSPDMYMYQPYSNDVFMSPRRRGAGSEYAGGVYPPPPMPGYPGAMHNGYPNPYYEGSRRPSFEHGYERDDPVGGNYHKRRSSYDRTGEPYHPRQGSYEQAPGDFPQPRAHHHPRAGSRDYEQDGYSSHPPHAEKRRSTLSEASSDLSASRTRVSWNMEVIEHIRTPSDGSDFDLNQL